MEKLKLYDTLCDCVRSDEIITAKAQSRFWSLCETEKSMGMAMTTFGATIRPMLGEIEGLGLNTAAKAIKSWNLYEASFGMAAINAYMNTREHMESLSCEEPYDNYCTAGLDVCGKSIGVVGHLNMPEDVKRNAREIIILERAPKEGDYPDSACEYLLPSCDIVIMTGSTLINKTLPRLLELCKNAYTIVTGPTVPMCPELLDFGIDRLAGMIIEDRSGMRRHVLEEKTGSPFGYGQTWLLKK